MRSKEYLLFTKRERTGIITLVLLLIIISVLPKIVCRPQPVAEKISEEQLSQLVSKKEYYREKDTVWMGKEEGRKPYRQNSRYTHQFQKKNYPERPYKKQFKKLSIIDINIADTSAFIALPGIGSKLAARIILFRERLGGFYTIEQIREVYGLQDSVYQKIRASLTCNAGYIKKLDINSADKDALKQHPYIRWNIANAVISYRDQHGGFISLQDLEKINNIDSGALKKMLPYLTLK